MPNVRSSWIGQRSTKGLKRELFRYIGCSCGRQLSCWKAKLVKKQSFLKIVIFLKLYKNDSNKIKMQTSIFSKTIYNYKFNLKETFFFLVAFD